jgi:hypothetical protein
MKQPRSFSTGEPSYLVLTSTSGSVSATALTASKETLDADRALATVSRDVLPDDVSFHVRFALEDVVVVVVPAGDHRPDTRDQVCGQEQGAPALILSDVDALVGAAEIERVLIAADHDMSQRHRRHTAKRKTTREQPPQPWAMRLDGAFDHPHAAATQCKSSERQPEQRSGESPETA